MELMGQWAPNMHIQSTDDKKGLGEDLGFMPFPAVEGGAGKITDVMGGGNGYIFGKNAPKEAVEFLKFMMELENYKTMVTSALNLSPTVKGAVEVLKNPISKQIVEMVSKAEYFQLYYDQYLPPAVGQAVLDATQGIFAGTKTPKEAADIIEAAMAENSK